MYFISDKVTNKLGLLVIYYIASVSNGIQLKIMPTVHTGIIGIKYSYTVGNPI